VEKGDTGREGARERCKGRRKGWRERGARGRVRDRARETGSWRKGREIEGGRERKRERGERERGREEEKEKEEDGEKEEGERVIEVLLTVKKCLKVGKYHSLSGKTASGRTGSSI